MARTKTTPCKHVPISTPDVPSPPSLPADVLERIQTNKLLAQAIRAARQSGQQIAAVPLDGSQQSVRTTTRLLAPTEAPHLSNPEAPVRADSAETLSMHPELGPACAFCGCCCH